MFPIRSTTGKYTINDDTGTLFKDFNYLKTQNELMKKLIVICLLYTVEVQGYFMRNWLVRKWLRKMIELVNIQRLITGLMLVIILILLSALFWQIANDENCAAATVAKTSVAVGGSHRNAVAAAATKGTTNNRFSTTGLEETSSDEEGEQSSADETAEENEDLGLDEDYEH
jgi:hypothetical protein